MRETIATAKDYDEAIEKGCAELGVSRDDVDFEVLEMGKKKLLGSTPWKIRVFVNEPEKEEKKAAPKPEKKPAPKKEKPAEKKPLKEEKAEAEEEIVEIAPDEKAKEKIKIALDYVDAVVKNIGASDITITSKYTNKGLIISVDGEDVGVIIGKRGESLDALQTLTGLAANKKDDNYLKVAINSGDYREKRKKTLEELAIKVAKTVAETGRKHTFEPMSAYERRIIHSAAATVPGVTSKSFGDEPERKVVILSLNPKSGRGDRRGNRRDRTAGRDNAPKADRPVGGTNHSDDSAYFSLLDDFE